MSPEGVLTIAQQAIQITLLLCAPPLAAALVAGLLVSIFQAATQINEMSLSFIPKLVAILAVLVLAGPWMLETLLDYVRGLFSGIPGLIG